MTILRRKETFKQRKEHVFLLIALLYCQLIVGQGNILINELMQSNVDFLMIDHDFPDSWVELYNGSDKTLQIGNYRIGPSNVFSESFRLSSSATLIEPGGYLLLYCDKTTGVPFHYDFNLESDEGTLYLFNNQGIAIDSVFYNKMPSPNVALGRITDGSNEWQYELTPTPGGPNNSIGSSEVLPAPLFSSKGRLMTSGPKTISISMPESVPDDTRIYLTTDGSEPTWESKSNTHFTIDVNKSMVIRAKLLSKQMLPSRSTTHSYIFHPRDTKLPIVCIATDSIYLYSSENGILSNDSTDGEPNYSYEWRRPANFEYFNTESSTTVFNHCGEIAVGGGGSRKMPQKSINCYAKKRFGKKNFNGNFWRDKPDVTKVKSFMLRNGGQNCKLARINDAAVQKFFGTNLTRIDWQAYEPVIVYINGEYKGIFGLRERSNEDYVSSNYFLDDEDIEIATATNYWKGYIKSTPLFNDFFQIYLRDGVTHDEIMQVLNEENFMNVFIAECYSSNTDYPHNNVSMWRQIADGCQWNWILKDLDYIYKYDASFDMFKYMLGTGNEEDQEYELSNRERTILSRYLYEKMVSFPAFRERFIATYATYLGDFLRPDICIPIVQQMDNEILDELAPTFEAYNKMSSLKKHNSYIKSFCDYINARPQNVYQQMADYFSLGNVIPICVTEEHTDESAEDTNNITICDVPLRTGRFDGAWFTSFPLSLNSDAENATWVMTITHANSNESTFVYNSAKIHPTLASCTPGDSVTFKATNANIVDTIALTHSENNQSIVAIYDTTGKKLSAIQHGINIILFTDGTRKKVINI